MGAGCKVIETDEAGRVGPFQFIVGVTSRLHSPCRSLTSCAPDTLTRMDRGIRFEFLWNDADVVEVRLSAWNGLFGGSANIYVGIGELAESAGKLKGFPHNPSDKRILDFGSFAPKAAGGAATLSFYCRDSAGRASVEVKIESHNRERIPAQSVLLVAAVEPAAVDSFVSDLRRLETDHGTAFLKASG